MQNTLKFDENGTLSTDRGYLETAIPILTEKLILHFFLQIKKKNLLCYAN